jgi:hypothetical protein
MGKAFTLALEHRNPDKAEEGYKENLSPEFVIGEQERMEIAQCKLLSELYLAHYNLDPDDIEREVAFNDPIAGQGFLDGVFGREGLRIGVEDKLLTANFWREADERKLAIDAQVTAYFYAMRSKGQPLDELLYRVTFKPTIKQDSRKKETLGEYLKRLRDRIEAEPEKTFKQYTLYRSDHELDLFAEEAEAVNKTLKFASKLGAWPKNTQSCTMYGECAMLSICRNDPGLDGKYRVKPVLPKPTVAGKRVLWALATSFVDMEPARAIAKQAGMAGAGTARAIAKLLEQELVEIVSPFELQSTSEDVDAVYRLTSLGRQVARTLA